MWESHLYFCWHLIGSAYTYFMRCHHPYKIACSILLWCSDSYRCILVQYKHSCFFLFIVLLNKQRVHFVNSHGPRGNFVSTSAMFLESQDLCPLVIRVNQAMFSGSSNIDSYGSGKEVRKVQMPSASSKEVSEEDESIHASGDPYQIEKARPVPYHNLQMPNLITLSLLPRSQWQSLTNLDIIKVRIGIFLSSLMDSWFYIFTCHGFSS